MDSFHWGAGAPVSVNLTGLRGCGDYRHCWIDAVVLSESNQTRGVWLVRVREAEFELEPPRIAPRRGAMRGRLWRAGDLVHVRTHPDLWWEATVVGDYNDNSAPVIVCWTGSYVGWPSTAEAAPGDVRAAE